jgi:iron complex transport system ATP-binding protein
MNPALQAERLTLGYDGRTVLDQLDLSIDEGSITTLIGANGSGKSTLLKAFGRLLTPTAGTVRLFGRPIGTRSARDVARELALLPQRPLTPAATTVRDLVMRGRHPHQSLLRPWTRQDAQVAEAAMAATGVAEIADSDVNALSGGQLQRAWIALVLAQQTRLILLDEPTTFLDLAYQIEVLDLLHDLNVERGKTIVMVLHDLNHACRYADTVVAIRAGKIAAQGAPEQVVTEPLVREVFGIDCRVIADPVTGTPLVVPIGKVKGRNAPMLSSNGKHSANGFIKEAAASEAEA